MFEVNTEGLTAAGGDISESGEARSKIEPLAKDVALQVPDSSIRIIPRCRMGDGWYYGRVTCPDSTREYLVSYGTNIMVQSTSLPILHRATGGRMTAQRLWRLAMWQGFSEGKRVHAMFDSIDYGEVMEGVGQNILITPGIDDLTGLEELGDVELIKTAITHEGKFWIWMRPDRSVLLDISRLTFNSHLLVGFLLEVRVPPNSYILDHLRITIHTLHLNGSPSNLSLRLHTIFRCCRYFPLSLLLITSGPNFLVMCQTETRWRARG